MAGERKLVQRSQRVSYLKVDTDYKRLRGFTTLTTSKNPIEYERQYVDEAFATSDVVGMSPSTEFEMDYYTNDPVHEVIADIFNNEKVGDDANVTILVVDLTKESTETPGSYEATERVFACVPDGEGDGTEAYIYTGTFKVKGEKVKGLATSSDDFQSVTFTPES